MLPSNSVVNGVYGDGLSAIFTLENGFDISSGKAAQSGRLFGRQAFVGLHGTLGTVTLGRQYDSMAQFVSPQSAAIQWGGLYAAHWGNLDNMSPWSRNNNAVKFTSTSLAGVSIGAIYSFSNQAGQFSTGNAWGVGGGYKNGPWRLGIAYTLANNPYTSDPSAISDPGPLALTPGGPYANLLKAQQQSNFGVSGAYQFGAATLGLVYTHVRLRASQIVSASGNDATFDNYEINGAYHVTPAMMLGAEYAYTAGRVSGQANGGSLQPRFQQVTLIADYRLSKRTDVYVLGAYQHAGGDGIGSFNGGKTLSAFAQIDTLAPSSTGNQLALRVGMRHTF